MVANRLKGSRGAKSPSRRRAQVAILTLALALAFVASPPARGQSKGAAQRPVAVLGILAVVNDEHFETVAFPLIGAGTGGFNEDKVSAMIVQELESCDSSARAVVVHFKKR